MFYKTKIAPRQSRRVNCLIQRQNSRYISASSLKDEQLIKNKPT